VTIAAGFLPLVIRFAAAFAIAAALMPLCRRVAIRRGVVAKPRADRWHRKPTPLLGGLGIALTVLVLSALTGIAHAMLLPIAAGALILAVGITDDVLLLKPSTKLIAEIALASLLVFFDYRLHWTTSLTIDTVLTLVWIVGVTNAFNLLDNMDGLCGGIALIVGASLLAGLVARVGPTAESQYLALLLGANTGFLIYNVHPASIFMGDGGSLFLGLSLAALTLSTGTVEISRPNVLSIVAAPVLVLLIPIFDITLVTVLRLLSGRSVAQGGRDHSSHRLVAIGLSERAAVGVLWTLGAAGGLVGFAVRRWSADWSGLIAAVCILAMAVFAVYLAHVRVYEQDDEAIHGGSVTPFVAGFMYKRRVAEVLLDVCLVSIAYYSAWRLRFEGDLWRLYFPQFLRSLPIVLAVQMVTLFLVGAYRGAWRYFGLMDSVAFTKGVLLGTIGIVVAVVYLNRFEHYSRGVFVIYAALLTLMLCASRASFRLIAEYAIRRRDGTRLVIYGAGDAGSLIFRELLNGGPETFRMLGFVDDDPATHRLRLHGYPVLGGHDELLSLIETGGVDAVVISARHFDAARLHTLESICLAGHVRLARARVELEELVGPI
jgi:UDP-GlcNAc:undecaprenyl-phosphate/decaprenyl-phosphate GlcNAc-1-phosphate transferase